MTAKVLASRLLIDGEQQGLDPLIAIDAYLQCAAALMIGQRFDIESAIILLQSRWDAFTGRKAS